MDYDFTRAVPNFNSKKFKIYITLQVLSAIYLVLFLAPNSLGFETNDNSKITAGLEVDGALKAGSVEVTGALKVGSLADSTGVVTSTETIENNDNDTTVPTTKAVKTYVDSATASSSSSSALPSHIVYSGSFNRYSDNEFFTAESGLLTGMKWVAADNQFKINSSSGYEPIPVIELLHSNGSTTVNASFSVTRLASYLSSFDGYQYLTGGSTKNSSLDMTTGNVLRVTLTEWGSINYFYEIIAIRSANTVNVTIRKGGVL
ncbi:MAG: hypothetical protein P8J25_01150 [Porticoccaceae bacterium]|nr:hypothetical protein [Porticoccaceae bacterium]